MPFITRAGVRLHYMTRGEELHPAIVLIQGLGLSSRFWFDVPDLLANDPDRPRRVLAVDNRGTGGSERPRTPWTMGAMADDVAAMLDDARVERAIVVGISMGGMIAQHVALRHPTRVSGLVLLATTAGFIAGQLPEAVALYRLITVPFGGKRGARNLARVLLPKSKWSRARDIFADWPNAMRDSPTAPATFLAHLFAASTHFSHASLRHIGCPTLVVAGDEDDLVPKRNAEVLARRIPNAELEILADTGHAIFAEDRDLVRRLVVRVEGRVLSSGAPLG